MTTSNYVQVPPNSSGLKIDTSEVTTAAGNVVERQNVVLADPANPANLANVTSAGSLQIDGVAGGNLQLHTDLLMAIYAELRVISLLMTQQSAPVIVEDLDAIRSDITNDPTRFN